MRLSWTEPWDVAGFWTRTPPEDDVDDAAERDASGSASEDAATAEPEVHELPKDLPGDDTSRESVSAHEVELAAFPAPWPAYATIRFSPDGGLSMEVFGPLGDFFENPELFTLFGKTQTGQPCTLLGARVSNETGTFGGHARRRVSGSVFIRGAHAEALEDLLIVRARLRFQGLRDFLWHPDFGPVGLHRDQPLGEPAAGTRDTTYERLVTVPGAQLRFGLYWEGPRKTHFSHRDRVAEVEVLVDEPLDFEGWLKRWVAPLRNLLVFATRDPSRLEAFAAVLDRPVAKRWWKPNDPERTESLEVDFVQQQSALLLPRPERLRSRVLFALGELHGEADSVLSAWFDLQKRLDPTADLLFGALNSRMYLENRLVNLTSAAEGYHRALPGASSRSKKHHKNMKQHERPRSSTTGQRRSSRNRRRSARATSSSWSRRVTISFTTMNPANMFAKAPSSQVF